MKRSLLPAAILSLIMVSTAWALPSSPSTMRQNQVSSTDLVQIKDNGKGNHKGHKGNYSKNNNWNKHHNYNHAGRYHYGNRYWGHRYNYRPYDWETLGCIAVGPIWYCP